MKKKSLIIALIVVMIAVITTACSKTEYTLDLPKEADNYTSVSLQYGEDTQTFDTAENIQSVIDKLTAKERVTTQKELGAVIDENEKIRIDFEFCKGGISTLYVLQKDDKYYIEQDLNGVYEITQNEYNDIKELLE